jgi:dimethylargininase
MPGGTIALTHVPSPRMDACVRTFAAVETIDLGRVAEQHAAYRTALERAGATVEVLDDNREHPDAVFIEDAAIVLDEVAILCSPAPEARRAEPAGIAPALARHRRVVAILPPATIEGGDVLRVGRTILVGRTGRTNGEGIAALVAIAAPLGYAVVPVDVRGCLHLKTACTALPDGALLVNPGLLPDLGALEAAFPLVAIDPREPLAANVVAIGDAVVAGAYPRTAERIAPHARDVIVVDLGELAKADGSATCLSILIAGR